jgi:hypothetical protein
MSNADADAGSISLLLPERDDDRDHAKEQQRRHEREHDRPPGTPTLRYRNGAGSVASTAVRGSADSSDHDPAWATLTL